MVGPLIYKFNLLLIIKIYLVISIAHLEPLSSKEDSFYYLQLDNLFLVLAIEDDVLEYKIKYFF